MSNFIGGLIQFVFRIEEQYSGKIYGYFSNKTLSSKLEYLHFSFAAWPENQENALTHTHTLVRVHTKHSELKGFKKVEIMTGYPFIHLLFRDCGQKIMTYFYAKIPLFFHFYLEHCVLTHVTYKPYFRVRRISYSYLVCRLSC